jgi:hypothetical protein
MKDKKYGENGTTQGAGDQGSKLEGKSRRLGTFSGVSTEPGTYQIGTGRKNSDKSDISVAGGESPERVAGKLLGQLICEADKQLAYYEQQVNLLRCRIEELKQISETINTK